jgi:hypothetical protein
MNPAWENGNGAGTQDRDGAGQLRQPAELSEWDSTLRLIASVSVPEGLEERVHAAGCAGRRAPAGMAGGIASTACMDQRRMEPRSCGGGHCLCRGRRRMGSLHAPAAFAEGRGDAGSAKDRRIFERGRDSHPGLDSGPCDYEADGCGVAACKALGPRQSPPRQAESEEGRNGEPCSAGGGQPGRERCARGCSCSALAAPVDRRKFRQCFRLRVSERE